MEELDMNMALESPIDFTAGFVDRLYLYAASLSWRDSRVEPLTQQQVLDGLNKLEARSVTEEKEEKEQQEQADLTGGSEARLTLRRKDGNGWSLLTSSMVQISMIESRWFKPGS
ncbi:hypothetical protein BDP27DRAFT_1371830 [Rhodocollybia butyracea]|uniref:Uncharacterized protein n=1 Tax=Rhodocollybia butyracea TaxID=206335 RepID=A0A9P5PAA5_9AGAR|nr:hypothetical protein BDP27DRAFT_1371830 [Rhodocollybia butyracea]